VFFAEHIPTIVVGAEQADSMNRDSQNVQYMQHALVAESTDAAMRFAYQTAKTDKVIIFDGAVGGLNLSKPLAEFLMERAPSISRNVDEVLLPKWLQQRGINPAEVLGLVGV
jgi:hypothetical protein